MIFMIFLTFFEFSCDFSCIYFILCLINFSIACRRKRTTEQGISDFDALLNAIKCIKIGESSIRKAGLTNNIPDRSLSRYLKKFNEKVEDITGYTDEQLLQILRGIASYKNVAAAHSVVVFLQ